MVTEPFALGSNYKQIIHAVDPIAVGPIKMNRQRAWRRRSTFDTIEEMRWDAVVSPLSMGVFAYPHREGARLTTGSAWYVDGEKDYGIKNYTIVVKERNFISNMRTVYREGGPVPWHRRWKTSSLGVG